MSTALAKQIDIEHPAGHAGVGGVLVASETPSSQTSSEDLGEKYEKTAGRVRAAEVYTGAPLGVPSEEKRFWWQRGKTYDPDAIATQPSVFDDPETAKE
jgi:hypothetical protein